MPLRTNEPKNSVSDHRLTRMNLCTVIWSYIPCATRDFEKARFKRKVIRQIIMDITSLSSCVQVKLYSSSYWSAHYKRKGRIETRKRRKVPTSVLDDVQTDLRDIFCRQTSGFRFSP